VPGDAVVPVDPVVPAVPVVPVVPAPAVPAPESPTQSLELYRHLKLRNQVPVRLVRYPGEPHGNRRAASRLDYSLRMMQWFDHYLQGAGGAMPAGDIAYEERK
jgi:hypothetical protein